MPVQLFLEERELLRPSLRLWKVLDALLLEALLILERHWLQVYNFYFGDRFKNDPQKERSLLCHIHQQYKCPIVHELER